MNRYRTYLDDKPKPVAEVRHAMEASYGEEPKPEDHGL